MFERFTERARQVVVLAQEEARNLGHDYIGTEHLLLGLMREEEGLAARVLEARGLSVEEARKDVVRIVGEASSAQGRGETTGQLPFTPRVRKVLELALREALSLGHNYIGTEHILLALTREDGGIGARVLRERGLDSETIRDDVIRMFSGRPTTAATRTEPSKIVLDAVKAGAFDDRLPDLFAAVQRRIEDLAGRKRCPVCDELLESDHIHDGVRISLTQSESEDAA